MELNQLENEDENDEHSLIPNTICRICLENDDIDNLIYPCMCNGNSKYVHKRCLNEWRNINHNPDNFKRCEVCHYEYDIVNVISRKIKCMYFFVKNWFLFFFINYMIMLFSGAILLNIDSDNVVLDDMMICTYRNHTLYIDNKEVNYNACNAIIEDDNKVLFYSLISGVSIFIITILLIFVSYFFIKNKRLYCKHYSKQLSLTLSLTIMSFLFIFLFPVSLIFTIFLLETIYMYILQTHFLTIIKISDSQSSEIRNYNPT